MHSCSHMNELVFACESHVNPKRCGGDVHLLSFSECVINVRLVSHSLLTHILVVMSVQACELLYTNKQLNNSESSRNYFVWHLFFMRVFSLFVCTKHKHRENFVREVSQKDPTYELVGSWRVDVGDQDQVVNIWRYQKGYAKANETRILLRSDSSLTKLVHDQTSLLRSRQNQLMMAFSFWGHPVPAIRDSSYEMRSYILKPGTMIEWGNNWWVDSSSLILFLSAPQLLIKKGDVYFICQVPSYFLFPTPVMREKKFMRKWKKKLILVWYQRILKAIHQLKRPSCQC